MNNLDEDIKKNVINKLEEIRVCGDKAELWNFEAGTILNLIEKQQNKIKDVATRLEYYLIGNFSLNDYQIRDKELNKLLKLLKE